MNIPEKCYIRWQAGLAVLEDLQDDPDAKLKMSWWYRDKNGITSNKPTVNWTKHECNTSACFAGWMAVAPYCKKLGLRGARNAQKWLSPQDSSDVFHHLFRGTIDKGSSTKTLAYLESTLKRIFKESTGKTLKAPLTFYV